MKKKPHRFTSSAICLGIFCSAGAFPAFGQDEDRAGASVNPPGAGEADYTIELRYANFDPLTAAFAVEPDLAADAASELYLVQFQSVPLDAQRDVIEALGGSIYRFVPNHAHIVRMPGATAGLVSQLPFVRWVGDFHPAYKLDEAIGAALAQGLDAVEGARAGSGEFITVHEYSIEVFERAGGGPVIEQPALEDGDDMAGPAPDAGEPGAPGDLGQQAIVRAAIEALGGSVSVVTPGGFRMQATLTMDQLVQVARMNEVHFIDPWGYGGSDMNIVRSIGGANFIEGLPPSYSGQGVRGEVFDTGIRQTHQEFTSTVPVIHSPSVSLTSHGTSTYSIVFARGAVAAARGLLPNADTGYFFDNQDSTQFGGAITRMTIASDLVSNAGVVSRAVFQTSSVGNARTLNYTTISAERDDVLFQTGLLHTQSQSNAGSTAQPRNSRPQAWSKNIVSGGAVNHFNTAGRADDTFLAANCGNGFGGTSIGPAADARVKPDLCFFYDCTLAASSTNNASYNEFGGTSGATPSIGGYMGLFHQLWHDGVWAGSGSLTDVFDSRPKFTLAKAALINSAHRYDWNMGGPNASINRFVQGWGTPDLRTLYDARNRTYFVNETHLLSNGGRKTYTVKVAPGERELNVTMVYMDPMGTTSATTHRINDLSLCVISPGGVSYWGNRNLTTANFSTPGGASDVKNTVENVFILNPQPGQWRVHVLGDQIVQDAHTETGATDADYALWVTGATESNCLTSTYYTNNGHHGAMFDITASQTITITGFDYQQRGAAGGRSDDIEVWYWPTGSYVGHENSPVGWVLMGAETVAGVGDGAATHVDIGGLTINAGQTRGIYFTVNAAVIQSLAYKNTTGAVTYSNGEIELELGVGKEFPWASTFNDRQWNGTVCYRTTSASVREIGRMTVDNTCIDMDNVGPTGRTTVAAVNAAGSPLPGNIANIRLTRPTAAAGVYNTQTGRGRALAARPSGNLDLWLVDPPAGAFDAFESMIIDLGTDSTQFGFSIGDWNGPANVNIYKDGMEIGHLDGISFAGSPDPHFIESTDPFDRVEITLQPQFSLGNWVVPDLCIELPGGCVGDLDGDGDTDLADLGILLADFGCTPPPNCVGDLDGDGDTDLADLGILLADFGCTP